MEVAHSALESFQRSFRKKSPFPLGELVEVTRKGLDLPNHLLDTKIFAKLQGNDVIQAEPSAIHFGGFELGRDYQRVLKLINISSEVVNIHIIPTQTKYFKTKYSKKCRLVPGLSYTVKVHFCPDEWRYFYDCVRIHCKGDENLVVPVHAYPVINNLEIPPYVSLPPVPLGQSVSHCIPLSCSCPIDFEFQVYCIEPHKAFNIQPLSGVIPANGKVKVAVKFTPLEYGTAQTTLQLVISQFNSKPYVCTLTGDLLSLPGPRKQKEQQGLKPPVDVTTPAGVAKVLIQRQDKMTSKDLREAMSRSKMGFLSRQMKEALFEGKVRQDVQEERANTLRWQVHLGKDPVCSQSRKQILGERELAIQEYKMKREDVTEAVYGRDWTRLSPGRVLRAAGQLPDYVPEFHTFPSSPLEVRQRALSLFQQAAPQDPSFSGPGPCQACSISDNSTCPLLQAQGSTALQVDGLSAGVTFSGLGAFCSQYLGPTATLGSSAPPLPLLRPPNAHPLRIFNPAPGLQAFKQPPHYLECDPEFHLCPLLRYPIPKGASVGVHAASTQRKFLDRTEVIRGVMTWKKFQSAALSSLSSPHTLTSSWTPRMSDPFNEDLLPALAPPALTSLPKELKEDVMEGLSESEGGALTPEMLRAEFHLPEGARPKEETSKDHRQAREPEKDQAQTSKLASKVQARLRCLKTLAKTDFFH
ncbi:hypothetical protein SKAU_G00256920 [Synaphobranchus kaupii]|uniref:Cep192-like domain-containing protein n=1 Tax=Synaphobranchus kaupii TaxID=118154 RepID=A0A9Q1F3X6_SYNKA|nr:hypothetical protein SKAU_G00256920 [Synaphobranchus kaupii]